MEYLQYHLLYNFYLAVQQRLVETIDRGRQSTLVGTVNQRIDFDFYLLY